MTASRPWPKGLLAGAPLGDVYCHVVAAPWRQHHHITIERRVMDTETSSTTASAARRVDYPGSAGTTALALLVGAIAFAAGDLGRRLVLPDDEVTGIPDMVRRVQAHSGLWLALGLAVTLGSLAMLPGILRILYHPQVTASTGDPATRGQRTIRVGAFLVALGLVASVAHALAFYGMAAIDGTSGAPMSAVTAMEDASNSYPLFVLVIIAFIAGMTLGPILLTWGLRRARLLPIWVPMAAVVFAVTGTVGGLPAGIVGLASAVVTFGMVARMLTRRSPAVP